MRIIVFGDSISEGFWDYEKGGWVNMLKIYLWKKYGYNKILMNFGISAYTSENILKVFSSFFNGCSRREIGKEKETTIIIAIGINDCSIYKKNNKFRVNIKSFEENINTIIDNCKKEELIKKVVFIGNTNINEEIVNNDQELELYFYNKNIKEYNIFIEKLCNKNKIEYLDLFGSMNIDDLEDGLHPNTKGHTKIFNKIKYFLKV